jgi:hypothetical protein
VSATIIFGSGDLTPDLTLKSVKPAAAVIPVLVPVTLQEQIDALNDQIEALKQQRAPKEEIKALEKERDALQSELDAQG